MATARAPNPRSARLPERHRRAILGTPVGATTWWDRGRLWVFGGVTPDGTMRTELWTFTPRLPKRTYTLPIGWQRLWRGTGSRCYYAGRPGTWTLRGDEHQQPRVWMQKGQRTAALPLPDGWHARFGPRMAITDSSGRVRYRGGETCAGNTGTGG